VPANRCVGQGKRLLERAAGAAAVSRSMSARRSLSRSAAGSRSAPRARSTIATTSSASGWAARPVNSSCSSRPNEYMSLAVVAGSPRACSGPAFVGHGEDACNLFGDPEARP
jgi:hypothetical protein